MKRAFFRAALLVAATASTGCELLTGIHERAAVEAPVASDGGVDAGSCPEGTGDCDGLADNGCEAILATDSKNCGACGHDCLGDGCSASACEQVVMIEGESTPEHLAVSDAGLFWSTSKGVVRKLPLEGGNVLTIGDTPPTKMIAFTIALSDQAVYWTLFENLASDMKPGVVMRAGLDGASPQILFQGQNFPAGIAVDATSVYWSAALDDKIWRGAPNGGMPQLLATVPLGWLPIDIAVDKDHVYFAAYLEGSIMRVPKVAGDPEELADFQQNPFAIAVNNTGVYWTNINENAYTKSSVWMTPKDAPANSDPILIAENQYAATAITVDESTVYWAVQGQDVGVKAPAKGSIMKMPLDADGKPMAGVAPIMVAGQVSSPTAIKIYKGTLYWMSGVIGGKLFRMVQ